MNFHTKYELFRAYFERALGIVFERETEGAPEMLAESMRYSLEAGVGPDFALSFPTPRLW